MKEKAHRYDDDDRFLLLVRDVPQRYCCDLLRSNHYIKLICIIIIIDIYYYHHRHYYYYDRVIILDFSTYQRNIRNTYTHIYILTHIRATQAREKSADPKADQKIATRDLRWHSRDLIEILLSIRSCRPIGGFSFRCPSDEILKREISAWFIRQVVNNVQLSTRI